MSTLTAILTPSPDGTLHLPLPVEWRDLPIKVKAKSPHTSSPLHVHGPLKSNFLAVVFQREACF
jgi:hypothetical protein